MNLNMPDFSQFAIPNKEPTRAMPDSIFQSTTSILNEFYNILAGDEEIKENYVKRNYKMILDTCMERGVNQYALTVATHEVFLNILTKLLTSGSIVFEPDQIVKFNCICYDYGRLYNYNQSVLLKMLDIVAMTNNAIVMTLMGFHLSKMTASKIVAARYSTPKTQTAFLRTIKVIQQQPAEIMTEQNIVDILGKICVEPVTDLFIAMMFDTYTVFNSAEDNYVYSTMSNAVLNIVESLPLDGIEKVLTEYIKATMMTDKRSRFMLKSISVGDFPRINSVIDKLEYMGYNIY